MLVAKHSAAHENITFIILRKRYAADKRERMRHEQSRNDSCSIQFMAAVGPQRCVLTACVAFFDL